MKTKKSTDFQTFNLFSFLDEILGDSIVKYYLSVSLLNKVFVSQNKALLNSSSWLQCEVCTFSDVKM